MAKIDWHVVPCLCVMYLLAFLDRYEKSHLNWNYDIEACEAHGLRSVNVSNAAILGLKSDLNIETGTKYNTALTIFFVPYIIFEIPSNVLMKKLKPHIWCTYCAAVFRATLTSV